MYNHSLQFTNARNERLDYNRQQLANNFMYNDSNHFYDNTVPDNSALRGAKAQKNVI